MLEPTATLTRVWPAIDAPLICMLAALSLAAIGVALSRWPVVLVGAASALVLASSWGLIRGTGWMALTALTCLSLVARAWPKGLVLQWLIWFGAAALMLGIVPGFTQTIWPQGVILKRGATEFSPELRLQQVLVACILVCGTDVRRAWSGWGARGARRAGWIAPTAWVLTALMPLAWWAGVVRFELVAWPLLPLFVLHNAALVVLPEEVLFRGMLQHLMRLTLPRKWQSPRVVYGAAASVFALGHLPHGPIVAGLSLIAGLGYGAAHGRTGGLVGPVMSHLTVNVVHFVCFSYPALLR